MLEDFENKNIFSEDSIPEKKKQNNKIFRPVNGRLFFGVASALANYFSCSLLFIRITFVLGIFLGGISLYLYLLGAVLIPEEILISYGEFDKKKSKIKRKNVYSLLLFVPATLFLTFGNDNPFTLIDPEQELLVPILLIASGILVLVKNKSYSLLFPVSENDSNLTIDNKKILGICSAYSNYLKIDLFFLRMLWTLVSFITLGLGIVVYLISWFFIKDRKNGAL